jgi:hypothetical protein
VNRRFESIFLHPDTMSIASSSSSSSSASSSNNNDDWEDASSYEMISDESSSSSSSSPSSLGTEEFSFPNATTFDDRSDPTTFTFPSLSSQHNLEEDERGEGSSKTDGRWDHVSNDPPTSVQRNGSSTSSTSTIRDVESNNHSSGRSSTPPWDSASKRGCHKAPATSASSEAPFSRGSEEALLHANPPKHEDGNDGAAFQPMDNSSHQEERDGPNHRRPPQQDVFIVSSTAPPPVPIVVIETKVKEPYCPVEGDEGDQEKAWFDFRVASNLEVENHFKEENVVPESTMPVSSSFWGAGPGLWTYHPHQEEAQERHQAEPSVLSSKGGPTESSARNVLWKDDQDIATITFEYKDKGNSLVSVLPDNGTSVVERTSTRDENDEHGSSSLLSEIQENFGMDRDMMVEAILQVMRQEDHRVHVPLLVDCLRCLSEVCGGDNRLFDPVDVEAFESGDTKHKMSLVAQAQKEILNAMMEFPSIKQVQVAACHAIAAMATATPRRKRWIKFGAFSWVMDALEFFDMDSLVVGAAMGTLRALSVEGAQVACQIFFPESEVVQAYGRIIHRVMKLHLHSASIQRDGCAMLSNWSLDIWNNTVKVRPWEELSVVLQAMEFHRDDNLVMKTCCLALWNYTLVPANCQLLAKEVDTIRELVAGALQMNCAMSIRRDILDRLERSSSLSSLEGETKPPFWCHVCCVDLQSHQNRVSHCRGRRHRRRMVGKVTVHQFSACEADDNCARGLIGVELVSALKDPRGRLHGNPIEVEKAESHVAIQSAWGTETNALFESFAHPPYHLLHSAGGLEGALAKAVEKQHFLLVNIQQYSVGFGSFAVNRDVWADSFVQEMVQGSFILFQTTNETRDGSAYAKHFHVTRYPYVAILNPESRRVLWQRDDWSAERPWTSQRIVESMMDICSRYEGKLKEPEAIEERACEGQQRTTTSNAKNETPEDGQVFAIHPMMNVVMEFADQEACLHIGEFDDPADIAEFYELQQALLVSQL